MASGGEEITEKIVRSMKITELKTHLRNIGLSTVGPKAQLLDRLLNATGFLDNPDPVSKSTTAKNSHRNHSRSFKHLNDSIEALKDEISQLQSEIELSRQAQKLHKTETKSSLSYHPVDASSPKVNEKNVTVENASHTSVQINGSQTNPDSIVLRTDLSNIKYNKSIQKKPMSHSISQHECHDASPSLQEPISKPSTSSTSVTSPQDPTEMVKMIAQSLSLARLPTPEPPIFCGDPLQYPEWSQAFKTLIEQRALSDGDKIYYLKRYVSGSALDAISGYLSGPCNMAYQEAKALLDKRYGSSFQVSEAFRKKLERWPKIPGRDGQALRKFADFLVQCRSAMTNLSELSFLNDCRQNQYMLRLLPDNLVIRWNTLVVEFEETHGTFPLFSQFVTFLQKEAEKACHPITSLEVVRNKPQDSKGNIKPSIVSHNVDIDERNSDSPRCVACAQKHQISSCSNFLAMDNEAKQTLIKSCRLCYNCLKIGHNARNCRSSNRCQTCRKKHHTLLHEESVSVVTDSANCGNVRSTHKTTSTCLCSMIVPVWVYSKSCPNKRWLTYAMLDTQSDATFLTNEVASKIQGRSIDTSILLSTMTAKDQTINCKKYTDLAVKGYYGSVEIDLPSSFTRNFIPHNKEHIPTKDIAEGWTHLLRIKDRIQPPLPCNVGLLIGYNCPEAVVAIETIQGPTHGPYGIETKLGWTIMGKWSDDGPSKVDAVGISHRLMCLEMPEPLTTDDVKGNPTLISYQTKTKEMVIEADEVFKALEGDLLSENLCSTTELSQDDFYFTKRLKEGTFQREDGFYSLPLPFKRNKPQMPNNQAQALSRFRQLQARLSKNLELKRLYHEFMREIISAGEAELVPRSELALREKWYLPHHGVLNQRKPGKLRVVFDGSTSFQGHCLNNYLLPGPNLNSCLVGVLTRFRRYHFAVSCDIRKMFHQFRVETTDRDFFRFLWFNPGDSNLIAEFRMTVHLFGATSSPGCAKFGLNQIVTDHASKNADVTSFVKKNFYVDDGLTSCNTSAQAVKLLKETQQVLAKGNLKLHKFIANDAAILRHFPETDWASSKEGSENRALGIRWNTLSDKFLFDSPLTHQTVTRRNMLSTLASIYDPLGLLSPLLLQGKVILQQHCRGLDWDERVPEPKCNLWKTWLSNMSSMTSIEVDRCLQPHDFGEVISAQLHTFADASLNGYGCCSYLRLCDASGAVHCSLLYAKSRVIPSSKRLTVPRLELLSALLAAKVGSKMALELEHDVVPFFYTDSKIVLGYIYNSTKRFHIFVANRVSQITELTAMDSWHHIEGEQNPADIASRGSCVSDLLESSWFTGPSFIWKKETTQAVENLPTQRSFAIAEDDPEVKKTVNKTSCKEIVPVLEHVSNFSKWLSAIRFAALIKHVLQHRWRTSGCVLTVEVLQRAEVWLLSLHQQQWFDEELQILSTGSSIPNSSRISRLDAYVADDSLLRVGGRIQSSIDIASKEKHPIIVAKGHISTLIIRHHHHRIGHQGRSMTMAAVRTAGYWILGLQGAVSTVIYYCVMCRAARRPSETQMMSNLPAERTNPSPPFSYIGLDCFGPFQIKDGRKYYKRYGLIFACMASRAIHVELMDDMSTDCFINSLRTFIAIRGPIRQIRCDQGTNFVGAANELSKALKETGQSESVKDFLLVNRCDFVFNPPSSSHMGGSWERLIGNFRRVLEGLLVHHTLDSSSARTLMYEAMSIVNSRPLSTIDKDTEPLTPNHLLHMKSGLVLPPPGHFSEADTYSRKRWRRVQGLIQMFWNKWRTHYLANLQSRSKWRTQQRNVAVGDIVLLQENSVRTDWCLGRVIETLPSADGFVRKVKLRMGKGGNYKDYSELIRPVHKLVVLVEV